LLSILRSIIGSSFPEHFTENGHINKSTTTRSLQLFQKTLTTQFKRIVVGTISGNSRSLDSTQAPAKKFCSRKCQDVLVSSPFETKIKSPYSCANCLCYLIFKGPELIQLKVPHR
jgi:hypothetical protein